VDGIKDKSAALKTEIDHLSEKLGVRPMPVGFRTNDGLNIYVAEDGSYHFACLRGSGVRMRFAAFPPGS